MTITVRLTGCDANTAIHEATFADTTSQDVIASALKDKWLEVHELVAKCNLEPSYAFAEMHTPKYNDDASGDLTQALDTLTGNSNLVIVCTATTTTTVQAKSTAVLARLAVANTVIVQQKTQANSKLTKADEVRALITDNPDITYDELVQLAISNLGMQRSRARVYVKNNLKGLGDDRFGTV